MPNEQDCQQERDGRRKRRRGDDHPGAIGAPALSLGALRYRYVRDVLLNNLDLVPGDSGCDWTSPVHANLRGPGYYQ